MPKPPEQPAVPYYLQLYFELRRWPGHLLIDGGLYDQPAWTWELVDLAGSVYNMVVEENRRRLEETTGNV